MNIDEIKPLLKHPKSFCTCMKKADTFPWGHPEYSCKFTESMDKCSKLTITNIVHKAPCKEGSLRTQRDTSNIRRQRRDVIDLGDDNAPTMFPMDVSADKGIPVRFVFVFYYNS